MVEDMARREDSEEGGDGGQEVAGGPQTPNKSNVLRAETVDVGGVSSIIPTEQDHASMVQAAISYAARGWRVFPVKGKLPLVMWQEEATTDFLTINDWWTIHYPDAGIGLVTGNGLVVLDVDAKSGGLESFGKLLEEQPTGDLEGPVVRTGGGGLHLYFTSMGAELRNKTGVRPGIDIRGDGGYVVAPPSPHSSGATYKWEEPLTDTLPAWPFDLHRAEEPAQAVDSDTGIIEGARNSVLTSLAGSMRHRGQSELAIRAALLVENMTKCKPPLSEKEVIAIARSVSRYEPKEILSGGKVIDLGTSAMSMPDFMAAVDEKQEWLIEGLWLDSAIGFVVGPPKSFKSFFALEIAFALATGKPFLGLFTIPEPRTVLLIQEESSRVAFKERIRRTGLAYGETSNLFFLSNKPFNLESKLDIDRLRAEVATVRPALLILDPLSSFVRGNQNDAQNMGTFLRTLTDLRNEFEMGVLIVHHAKKSDPGEFRGSSVLYAGSEVTIRIRRVDESVNRSKVSFELKDGESPDTMDVAFQQRTGTLAPITQQTMLAMALAVQERKKEEEPHYNA
jgi:hypothetical protein